MAKTAQIEVYAIVDADGDYAVGKDAEAAVEKYTEDVGDLSEVDGVRTIKLLVTVPLPVEIVLSGVAVEDQEAALVVA